MYALLLQFTTATQVLSDNLYEMGGDSIQIVQFASNLNKTFNTNLSLQDVLEYPSLSKLANLVSGMKSEAEILESPCD